MYKYGKFYVKLNSNFLQFNRFCHINNKNEWECINFEYLFLGLQIKTIKLKQNSKVLPNNRNTKIVKI